MVPSVNKENATASARSWETTGTLSVPAGGTVMVGGPPQQQGKRTMANTGNSSGGSKGNPGNFANDREKAKEAGHVGGQHQGKENNPGNFANDRNKASEAGRKGGQQSHGGRTPEK